MPGFVMFLIRTEEGVVRIDGEDWDDALVNFGYEECEGVGPISLSARDADEAKREAEARWEEVVAQHARHKPEGYWIVVGSDLGKYIHMEVMV